MPWKESQVVTERARFCLEWYRRWKAGEGRINVTELCRIFAISRVAGYKWIRRFRDAGYDVRSLDDRSRRPRSSPTAVPEQMQDLLVDARKRFPTWGPRKLRPWLVERFPGLAIPSESAIALVLKRRGLTTPRRKRRKKIYPSTIPFAEAQAPNAVWCIDFKGKFRTADGKWCVPFTVTDTATRYCVRCEIVDEANYVSVQRILDSAFLEFGLPGAIRSDNGPPFASSGPAGLTTLAVWLLRLGIRLERIQPGKPQQNGRHERFHRTLLEAASPPRANSRAQQRAFDLFRRTYNEERPHQALGQRPPARLFTPSRHRYPRKLITPYDFDDYTARVERDGTIRFRNRRVFVSTALHAEYVVIDGMDGEGWNVAWGSILLGRIEDGRRDRLVPVGRSKRPHYLELLAMSSG